MPFGVTLKTANLKLMRKKIVMPTGIMPNGVESVFVYNFQVIHKEYFTAPHFYRITQAMKTNKNP